MSHPILYNVVKGIEKVDDVTADLRKDISMIKGIGDIFNSKNIDTLIHVCGKNYSQNNIHTINHNKISVSLIKAKTHYVESEFGDFI